MKLVEFQTAQDKLIAVNVALVQGIAKGNKDEVTVILMSRLETDVDEDFVVLGNFADTKKKLEESTND